MTEQVDIDGDILADPKHMTRWLLNVHMLVHATPKHLLMEVDSPLNQNRNGGIPPNAWSGERFRRAAWEFRNGLYHFVGWQAEWQVDEDLPCIPIPCPFNLPDEAHAQLPAGHHEHERPAQRQVWMWREWYAERVDAISVIDNGIEWDNNRTENEGSQ